MKLDHATLKAILRPAPRAATPSDHARARQAFLYVRSRTGLSGAYTASAIELPYPDARAGRSGIQVSTKLLDMVDDRALVGVVAHEVAHIHHWHVGNLLGAVFPEVSVQLEWEADLTAWKWGLGQGLRDGLAKILPWSTPTLSHPPMQDRINVLDRLLDTGSPSVLESIPLAAQAYRRVIDHE